MHIELYDIVIDGSKKFARAIILMLRLGMEKFHKYCCMLMYYICSLENEWYHARAVLTALSFVLLFLL